jgi:hypothetical protein
MQNNLTFAGFSIENEEAPIINSKCGTFSQSQVKYKVRLRDPEVKKLIVSNDYSIKKYNRNNRLREFFDHYQPLLKKNEISIICMIVYADKVNNINEFIKNFKRKNLRKRGIFATSHFRINDIGDKYRRAHYHVLIVTEPFDKSQYKILFKKSKEHKYKAIPMDNTMGLISYCQKKELYVKIGKVHSYSRSKPYKNPLQELLLLRLKKINTQ